MVRRRMAMALAAATFGTGWLGVGWSRFGPDPAQAYQLDTNDLIACAQDGGVCRMPYPTNVYYGVPGKTNGRPFPQGGLVPCTAQTFGDPAPGQPKSCWYAPRVEQQRTNDRANDRGYDRGYDRDRDPDDRRRAPYRYERDYDAPPARRPYDEDYGRGRRRDRGDPDDD